MGSMIGRQPGRRRSGLHRGCRVPPRRSGHLPPTPFGADPPDAPATTAPALDAASFSGQS